MTPQPPTQEQFELLEQLKRDAYPRLTVEERDGLRAVLAYARLGMVAATVCRGRGPRGGPHSASWVARVVRSEAQALGLLSPAAQEEKRDG